MVQRGFKSQFFGHPVATDLLLVKKGKKRPARRWWRDAKQVRRLVFDMGHEEDAQVAKVAAWSSLISRAAEFIGFL
ncbi:unnamed protein product [Boreogadus saida]